jgi:hypothetical protein
MSFFTAVPFKSETEMYQMLTSYINNIYAMDLTLAGVAFDASISVPENIQVRKSVVKNCHIILSDVRPCIHLRVNLEISFLVSVICLFMQVSIIIINLFSDIR